MFAGSSESTLRSMFARPSEPFYNRAPLQPFELLGPDFVAAMVSKANGFTRSPLALDDALQAYKEFNDTLLDHAGGRSSGGARAYQGAGVRRLELPRCVEPVDARGPRDP